VIKEHLFKTGRIVAWIGQESKGNERLDTQPLRAFVFSERPEGYVIRVGAYLPHEYRVFLEEVAALKLPFLDRLQEVGKKLYGEELPH